MSTRRGVNPWVLPAPVSFAEFNERVRNLNALHHGSVTGGGRTPDRNDTVGGSNLSKHLIEFGSMAVDVVLDNMAADLTHAYALDARTLGLWAEVESDHIHLQGLAPGA